MTLRQKPEGHSDIFSFDSLPPGKGSRTKKWKFTVYRISYLASRLTRHGAAFGKAAHLAGCPTQQGVPFGRVFHSAGYTIWQNTSLSKAFQPAHTVRKDLPIRGWQRYGRTCGRLAAATDCPMRRKRSSGSSTSSGSWGYSSASTRRQVSVIHSPPIPEATRPSTITWRSG